MKKKPQGGLEGSLLGRLMQTRLVVLLSNWVFQGMRYMNIYELTVKLSLDVVIAGVLLAFVWSETSLLSVLYSILIAHTLNWLINGHFFVLMRYVYPFPTKVERFHSFADDMKARGERFRFIQGLALYGSYCRDKLHEGSDLDVRVIVNPGPLNGFMGASYCLWERFKAFLAGFPLDIYCCSGTACLDKLRDDEIPVVLIDRQGDFAQKYGVS